MSEKDNKAIARRFVEEVFNQRKTDAADNYVTQDIAYHGMGEEVKNLPEFKRWINEDLSAFPDMTIKVLDDLGEKDKVAILWSLKATHKKDFAEFPATHQEFETRGVDIFHFQGDKIKEAWTMTDMSVLQKP
jgi:steroid delta-isomerase-like uncharacterized protein